MLKLNQLSKTKTKRSKKRLGRGYGSGKGGHTVGRGNKGQKARGKVSLLFAGTKGKKSWLKRLPLWRGKRRLKAKREVLAINLDFLDKNYRSGSKVSKDSLVEKKIVKKGSLVKILGRGKITKKLTVFLPCSKKAEKEIVAAGGQVVRAKKTVQK